MVQQTFSVHSLGRGNRHRVRCIVLAEREPKPCKRFAHRMEWTPAFVKHLRNCEACRALVEYDSGFGFDLSRAPASELNVAVLVKRLASLPKRKADFIEPMDCAPVTKLADGPGWLYEIKLDGYRAVAVKSDSRRESVFSATQSLQS
jgi:hypothetical protein